MDSRVDLHPFFTMNDGLFGLGQHVTILHSVQDELVSSLIAARDEIHQIRGGMNEIKIYLAREQHHFQKTLRDLAHAIGRWKFDSKFYLNQNLAVNGIQVMHSKSVLEEDYICVGKKCPPDKAIQQPEADAPEDLPETPAAKGSKLTKSPDGEVTPRQFKRYVLKGCNAGLKVERSKDLRKSNRENGMNNPKSPQFHLISDNTPDLKPLSYPGADHQEEPRSRRTKSGGNETIDSWRTNNSVFSQVLLQRYSSITQGMKRVKFEKAQEAANNAFVREKLRQEIKVLHRDKTDALKVMVDLQKELEALRRKFQERKGIFVRTEEYYTESL
eukprot:103081-Amorphochlora_amoeboformis.AAC.1